MDRNTFKTFMHDLKNEMSSFKVAQIEKNFEKLDCLIESVFNRIFEIEKLMETSRVTSLSYNEVASKFREHLKNAEYQYNNLTTNFYSTITEDIPFNGIMEHALLTLDELLRNAIKNGASKFIICVDEIESYLVWKFKDNGNGMSKTILSNFGLQRESGTCLIRKMAMESEGFVQWDSIEHIGTVVTIFLKKQSKLF